MRTTLLDRPAAPLLLLALWLGGVGCAPGAVGGSTSDGGTWSIDLADGPWSVGWNDLQLTVQTVADGAPADATSAELWMPAMGHGSTEDVAIQDDGDGVFTVAAFLQMAGQWELSGEVSPGGEGWSVSFEVIGD